MTINKRYRVQFQSGCGPLLTGRKDYFQAQEAAKLLAPYGARLVVETPELRRWWSEWHHGFLLLPTSCPASPLVTVECVPARPKFSAKTVVVPGDAAAELLAGAVAASRPRSFLSAAFHTVGIVGLSYSLGIVLCEFIRYIRTP